MVWPLMDASKLTIDPDKLRFQKMSHKKRSELRRKNMLDLINSKPAGTALSLQEFEAVTRTSSANVHAVIQHMVKEGVVTKTLVEGTKNRYCYSVVAAVTVKAPKEVPQPAITETTAAATEQFPAMTLGDYARDYAWESNDDSLRGFVKWMDGKELDVRRMLSGGGF